MNSLLHTLPHLLPIAEAFVAEHEKIILARGEPLTAFELTDARAAGVKHPGKIRVLRIDKLPLPERDEVLFIAKRMGLFQTTSAGLALHYGIYMQRPYWNDRQRLVHEFVHVAQYERMGSVRAFLEAYLHESLDPGFAFGRLNQEAEHVSEHICKPASAE